MSIARRTFTAEFKQEAVALIRRSGQSANQVAKELGVSRTALSRWLREATHSASGPNGFRAAEELKSLHGAHAGAQGLGDRPTARKGHAQLERYAPMGLL